MPRSASSLSVRTDASGTAVNRSLNFIKLFLLEFLLIYIYICIYSYIIYTLLNIVKKKKLYLYYVI